MARSGSASRVSRGVSSWSAAVSTPTCMNFGANAVMAIRLIILAEPSLPQVAASLAVAEGGGGARMRRSAHRDRDARSSRRPAARAGTGTGEPRVGAAAAIDDARRPTRPSRSQAGQRIFAAQCGFCHGRDAMGGESGPDLTRAAVVAEDVRGDKIGPLLRAGRVGQGHAGVHAERRRSHRDRRVHPRSEDQGGVADRRPPHRGRRRSADRRCRSGPAVLRRRLREVPFAHRRSRRRRQAAAGARAAAAHALSGAGPRRTRRRP